MTAPLVNILVAHWLEAKPLVRQLGLRQQSGKPHRLFGNDHGVALLVAGHGKQAMAAGVGYLAGLQQMQGPAPAWLNVGIAGHGSAEVGAGFLVNKIEDRLTGQVYYPTPGLWSGPGSALVTVDVPETGYPDDEAYDMEGAAFWVAANHYGVLDLLQLFKVVSDNPRQDVSQFSPEQVADLMNAQQPAIAAVVAATAGPGQASASCHAGRPSPISFSVCISRPPSEPNCGRCLGAGTPTAASRTWKNWWRTTAATPAVCCPSWRSGWRQRRPESCFQLFM
ncbi:MAG: hypothetical protein ACE37N_02470 [Pseudohongiellaceae bacterium]